MPVASISFENVQSRYADEIPFVMRKVKLSKELVRKRGRKVQTPAQLSWILEWKVKPFPRDAEFPKTLDEYVENTLDRVHKICLIGEADDWQGSIALPMFYDTPEELIEEIASTAAEEFAEHWRWESLTPEEQAEETRVAEEKAADKSRGIARGRLRTKARDVFVKAFVESGLEELLLDNEGLDLLSEVEREVRDLFARMSEDF